MSSAVLSFTTPSYSAFEDSGSIPITVTRTAAHWRVRILRFEGCLSLTCSISSNPACSSPYVEPLLDNGTQVPGEAHDKAFAGIINRSA